jgi:transcriptional regulator with XRE-family HTH domain
MLSEFSEELRSAREKSGVTLQQISQKSRIDIKYIEDIDRGEFDFLPELYVKAFIKQYAKIIGLDEQETMAKYEAAKKGKTVEEERITQEENSGLQKSFPADKTAKVKRASTKPYKTHGDSFQETEKPEPANFLEMLLSNKILLIATAASIAVVLFIIIYFLFLKSGPNIVVAEKPYDEIRKENMQRYVSEGNVNFPDKKTAVDSLTLEIQAVDSAWFYIRIDNSEILDFVLYPYSKRTLKAATGFKITLGNSGDTRLKLDNKNLPLTGKKKEVKYVYIDKDGLKYLKPPQNPDQQ